MGDWSLSMNNAGNQDDRNVDDDAVEVPSGSNRSKFTQGELNYIVVLATACIRVQIGTYISTICRAICDTGAQASLVSNACVKRIGLPTKSCYAPITGVGGSVIFNRKVQAYITPWFESPFRLFVEFLVGDDFGQTHPNVQIGALRPTDTSLTLADERFDVPGPIDMLLGADVWGMIIGNSLYRHITGAVMHETHLGHIILGRTTETQYEQINSVVFHATKNAIEETLEEPNLEHMLKRFFDNEELAEPSNAFTQEENAVEKFFVENSYRHPIGFYVTKIPLKPEKTLGESRYIVRRRFYALERKLQTNASLRQEYVAFMNTFIAMNHMQRAPPIDENAMHYYIPHHAVYSSGKFRCVFDGSCKTSNGESLNSIQMVGPKLQCDLPWQIMRFRRHKYAVVADIVKMFRQVGIDPSQWDLQRIFWREEPTHPLIEYQITRVTYGLASSGHNAVRSMHKCAQDHIKQYPEAAEIITKCFYMDDGLWGTDTINELKILCREVQFVLSQGGFELSKWASNSRAVEKLMLGDESAMIDICDYDAETKVLGLRWLKDADEFTIFVRNVRKTQTLTKRYVIGEIARLYDPNGYVSPVVIVAKMMMQDVWRLPNQEWDMILPEEIQRKWIEFVESLTHLNKFRIPRWLSISKGTQMEIHGFCDACIKAYGAVLYVRAVDENGQARITLLTSKTKVAPLKTITIPRLELLATVLCAKLVRQATDACQFYVKQYLWSDSMIALHWIKRSPCELKMYVANRVQAIKEDARHAIWAHVGTHDNPADLLSRGMPASEFVESKLWKQGPKWLAQPRKEWPKSKLTVTPEMHADISKEVKENQNKILSLFTLSHHLTHKRKNHKQTREVALDSLTNDLKKILRITAYVLRFIQNVRIRKNKAQRITRNQPLPSEIQAAATVWIKHAQMLNYRNELETLKSNDKQYLPKSKISAMRPIMDEYGILRVGGRIDKANVPYTQRHPIIVPPRSRLAYLILNQAHQETKHGGPQAMMAFIRTNYWIPQLRQQARKFVSQCLQCTRYAQITAKQIMAELPAVRLRPARPFDVTGIDLAGPFQLKLTDKLNLSTRAKSNLPEVKGWVAVFVCLVTRAVHLEPIMDLSADAFLQAYIRFVSRRGNPTQIFSDNGTNFVASDRIMREAATLWQDSKIQHYASGNHTKWDFITPGAPHEGGIWEAAVKSMKHHLRRVMGPQRYSYEGMSTLLAGIEACLNSRPLCAMSEDPLDMEILTPAHFLIGGPLKLPLPTEAETPPKTAKRLYAAIQSQTHSFWNQWSQDYLHSLMHRPKWKDMQTNVKIGQLALIKDENLPPTYWAMGRIVETHQAKDGCVRSVKLKVKNNKILERSIRKICILPTDQELGYWVEN